MRFSRDKFMRALLVPGLRLMGRLSVARKLGLVLGVLAVPMLLLLGLLAWDASQALRTLHHKREALPLVRALLKAERDLALLAADTGVSLPEARQRLQVALAGLDQATAGRMHMLDAREWPLLRQQLQSLVQPAGHPAPVFDVQDRLLKAVRKMGDQSGLLLDHDHLAFGLADLAIDQIGQSLRGLARLRSHLHRLARGEAAGSANLAEVVAHNESLHDEIQTMAARIDHLVHAGGHVPASWASLRQDAQRLWGLTDAARRGEVDPTSLQMAPALGEAVEAALSGVGEDLLVQLDRRLDERGTQMAWLLALRAALALLGLAAGAYLASTFYYSFTASLRAVTEGVQALTRGDLSKRFRILGSDELARVTQDLEGMAAKLSSLVAEIRSSAVRVDQSGDAVAADGRALADRNIEQGTHLRTTVGAIGSLDTVLQAHTGGAAAAQRITQELQQQAEHSRQAVGQAVGSVQALEASVRRVSEINAAIDDVAFQTNLLALNASVEAARAGAAGKGFAVVAQEVRQLATRCTDAAAQVRALVDQSLEQAALSMATIDDAQTALRGVGGGLTQLDERLAGLAEGGEEPVRLLANAREGVHGLEMLSRDNGDMVHKAAKSSQELADQAKALRQSVAATRLRQGGADEARALLERAMAHLARVGWAQAAADFNSPEGGFIDRDMYIYAFDGDGRYLVDGSRPERVGHRMVDVVQLDADRIEAFLGSGRQAAAAGGGWIDYDFPPLDGSDRPVRKSGYVMPLGDGFIGCSVHRVAAEDAAPARQAGIRETPAPEGSLLAPPTETPEPALQPA